MRLYAVYLPILQTDRAGSVQSAMKRLPDKRVSFSGMVRVHWLKVTRGFCDCLRASRPWDMYLLFNRDGEWKDEPPIPEYWMHQLPLDPARRLDGDKLAGEMKRLLEMK